MRKAALPLLLLALAGCHEEDELTIFNTGTEPVFVDIAWDEGDYDWYDHHHHRFIELPAGAIYNDDFGSVREMDVIITRKSDGLLLFADDFDSEDFADDHGDIEIAVNP
jgi:hypothetical protein